MGLLMRTLTSNMSAGEITCNFRWSTSPSSTTHGIHDLHDLEMNELVIGEAEMRRFGPLRPDNAPSVLSFAGVKVLTKIRRHNKVRKALLNNVTGTIAGGLYAIMGASGSGKTTLLCVLSHRLDTTNMTLEGELRLNGHRYSKADLKSMSGFVMQDDLLCATLTVEETLWYTAALRLPRTVPEDERAARIEEVMALMGIAHCRGVIIGDTRRKGISGGERKRVCVAMELLMRPKLLFLDEPTSGLDSATALSVLTALKAMTDRGDCTVVCTIHQPQTKIYNLFDNLILMKKGSIVYQGRRESAEEYFALAGFACPPRCNPADHLIDVLSIKPREADPEKSIVPKMVLPVDLDDGNNKGQTPLRLVQPWHKQFYFLVHRGLREKSRLYDVFLMNIFVSIVTAVFIGYNPVWHDIGFTGASVPKRNAILFFCVIHQGVVASLQGTFAFPMERALMLRERAAGTYHVSAYFMAKTLVETVFQLPPPVFFSMMVYPLCGLNPRWDKFFIFLANMILCNIAATSLATTFACICGTIDLASVCLVLAMEVTRLYSGFFVSPLLLRTSSEASSWQFADALSYMKYVYVGLCVNEYTDLSLHCVPSDPVSAFTDPSKSECLYTTGEQVMAVYGYDYYSISSLFGYLIVLIVGLRILAYLGLRFLKG